MAHMIKPDISDLFHINNPKFTEWASMIYQYQTKNNPIFQRWTEQFPTTDFGFLPIAFFKSHSVITPNPQEPNQLPEIVFSSSGTTGSTPSKHHVLSEELYRQSYTQAFELMYGPVEQYCFIGLLPSYLERSGSSLIYMVDDFIKRGQPKSGFYLNEYQAVANIIEHNQSNQIPTILFGVTFALLAMADALPPQQFTNTTIIETGGMKGRGAELTRTQLHQILSTAFGCDNIHSEYGMTELLSQAYAKQDGKFTYPPWMKILIQDPSDPKQYLPHGKTGRICVIDLANINSCSFIATDDLGKTHPDGTFEVLGRLDFSDLRGCNQLIQ